MSKNDTRNHNVPCPRCDGKGYINGFGHIADGRCFLCGGGRVISVAKLSESEWAKRATGLLTYDAAHCVAMAAAGRDDLVTHTMRGMLDDMFRVGTANARRVLAVLADGEWYDEHTGESGRIPAAEARALRDRLVAMGREAKAAAA